MKMMNFVPRYFSLPSGTWLLIAAQAVNLIGAVVSVTVAALVGAQLSDSPAWATLPYGCQFAAVMAATYPFASAMKKYGRRRIFFIASGFLFSAGIIGYLALIQKSFWLLVLAHCAMGIYFAAANFYRFAAVDGLQSAEKARVISWVVSGGVAAAFIGPLAATQLRSVAGFTEFSLCYAFMVLLATITMLLLKFWQAPIISSPLASSSSTRIATPLPAHSNNAIWLAIFSAAGGYFIMNLLMVQASITMTDVCSTNAAAGAIQSHVLAMFAPSFFTGILVSKIGEQRVLLIGFILLLLTTILGIQNPSYINIVIALILLGVGWNFCYVGGGALLATQAVGGKHHYWQGINDTAVAACATLGAFLPAPLLYWMGASGTNYLIMPLCFAGILLCIRTKNVTETAHESECIGQSAR